MDDIDRFLCEDVGKKGDITSDALFSNEKAKAVIIAKEEGVVAGLEEASQVFQRVGATTRLFFKDGDSVQKGDQVMQIQGSVRSILKGERLALNLIGRMSGITTETATLVHRCKRINPHVSIAATRKTTPGFRKFEKKAIRLGGGEPHRYGLYDAVLIKDNHLKMTGSIEKTLRTIRRNLPRTPLEIEVENEADALVAATLGAETIMLDNFDPKTGEQVTKKIRRINPRIIIEVSGGITADNIEKYASFADRISLGCLTHSVKNKDYSLEIIKK